MARMVPWLQRDSLLQAAERGRSEPSPPPPPGCLYGHISNLGWGHVHTSEMGCRQLLSANQSQMEGSRTLMEYGSSQQFALVGKSNRLFRGSEKITRMNHSTALHQSSLSSASFCRGP